VAGTMHGGRARDGGISGINVTPLVDVCLVLLIILMVASTYIVAQTLKVNLPKSKSTDGQADKPQIVAILKDGTLHFNDQTVSEEELVADVKDLVAADPEVNLVVSADKDTPHGAVVHVMDVAKQVGVVHFAINVMSGS
jgi:biopolymer transport protein ExbD